MERQRARERRPEQGPVVEHLRRRRPDQDGLRAVHRQPARDRGQRHPQRRGVPGRPGRGHHGPQPLRAGQRLPLVGPDLGLPQDSVQARGVHPGRRDRVLHPGLHQRPVHGVHQFVRVRRRRASILAVSNPSESRIVDTVAHRGPGSRETLAPGQDSQSLQPCRPSRPRPCTTDRHTYIYGAAITALGNSKTGAWAASASCSTASPSSGRCCMDSLPRNEQGRGGGRLLRGLCGPQGEDHQLHHATATRVGKKLQRGLQAFFCPAQNGVGDLARSSSSRAHYYAVGSKDQRRVPRVQGGGRLS